MTEPETLDGNEAATRVAYPLSEVIAIYPITPASPMGELADAWATAGRPNRWGSVPEVVEMQSEAGAAGALHGAATRGALATTFTASQGLLLMLPNMFKVAGELTPAVIHVAARAVATHALSIFGDHSDVMAARMTGWAMLASATPQEAADLALVSHAATLESRVPFLHFMDGFRTSHEIGRVVVPTDGDIAALVDDSRVADHRLRGLDPDRPVLRGSAQNPDVFFQAREAANPFYEDVPGVVERGFDRLAERTGRRYRLVEYFGAPDAERVVVLMGSGVGAALEAVEALVAAGEKVGLVQVRLYRPFPAAALLGALPETARAVAVLDRTKEPGAAGEPLRLDVVAALASAHAAGARPLPTVVGGRYGLGSKEFTPAMVRGVLDELSSPRPRDGFTVGIVDDVTRTSLPAVPLDTDRARLRAVFYGLGADGTVGANKQSAKIVGERTHRYAQGYFVYDSKKAGSMTVSHLRFDDRPIRSTYLIQRANFVACHQFGLLERIDVLGLAEPGATFLLNSPFPAEETWDRLPVEVQETILDLGLQVWVIDAHRVARDVGLPGRINTVMQVAFFELTDLLDREEALAAVKQSIEDTYGKRGGPVVEANLAAAEAAAGRLVSLGVPERVTTAVRRLPPVPPDAPDFVARVTARMIAGEGDLLPVSALPPDGSFPTGTARFEKRAIATEIPIWDPDICIDCGKCAIVCPHAAIRMKVFPPEQGSPPQAPDSFLSKPFRSREHPGLALTIQVAPDDCTGCGVCVEVCPAKSRTEVKHKAINMEPAGEHREVERERFDHFLSIPPIDPALLDPTNVKGSQVREPLFEFSGACAGCGETPYLKLLTQLFGDRILVANATGCSSIYGGNLPTTPWGADRHGRGPAWSNSLFEDNAEFGLGIRLALDHQISTARHLLERLGPALGPLAGEILAVDPTEPADDAAIAAQRVRLAELDARLASLAAGSGDRGDEETRVLAEMLRPLAGVLVRKSVWIVGGDGWAYDIGYGGLDHVLASGRDVNVLVLDTEVYSNTGGQASKATPRAAVAKFAAGGKPTAKKDLGLEAMSYGHVYVAQVALGASDIQTVKAFHEAESWPGPSLIIAYSTCIAHGIDMQRSMAHQRDAVRSGYWPLYRFHPGADESVQPFQLDSREPSMPLADFTASEGRFSMLARANPERATHLLALAQEDVDERWRYYSQLAEVRRRVPDLEDEGSTPREGHADSPGDAG
ncbi:MAG: pyruvate:ferredoxin (flavodoxin) oxidoreductase [Acidimicrobiia bacterium]|nr:pyruvate:ferredoxin (flavodoxin) oxidoreductase [Acidimicrobiia bacterium]